MFTINIYLRFALIAVGILGGIGLWAGFGFWYGFPFLLVGIILLAGYLLLGTIMSTNALISQMRLEEAEQRLKMTYFPGALMMGYKGVYYMTMGGIKMQQRDFKAAEDWVLQALAAGLPTDNERGAAYMLLASIEGSRKNIKGVQMHMAQIKKLNITEPNLKEQIKELETQLKQAGQTMNPAMMAMMGGRGGFRPGGSKRRSPKMR
jgi:hypothetical protein